MKRLKCTLAIQKIEANCKDISGSKLDYSLWKVAILLEERLTDLISVDLLYTILAWDKQESAKYKMSDTMLSK